MTISKLLLTLTLLLISLVVKGQQTEGLSLELERDGPQLITYPPQTEFYLFDDTGEVILADGDLLSDYTIHSKQILLVKPPYKDGYDRFSLRPGDQLSLPSKQVENLPKQAENTYGTYTGPITLKKEFLSPSMDGQRNVLLIFSNGLVFRYFNGQTRAWVDGEEVPVQGKYIVQMGSETVKFSYDPDSGRVWYVVEHNG